MNRVGRTLMLASLGSLVGTALAHAQDGGSYGNWVRHYFPVLDYVTQYRLVVATPNSPTRVWSDADDAYLQNIVSFVTEQIGASNIKAFWLTGHSQGGTTSNRLLRTEFSKTRVDGWLSLAGGRLGANPGRVSLGITPAAPATGSTGTASGTTAATAALATLPDADFSFIFTIGRHEMDEKGLPAESEWAKKYSCGSREAARERRHERGLRVRPEPSDSDVALLGTGARSGYGAGSAVSGLQRRPRRR